jgi:hypothetical protein
VRALQRYTELFDYAYRMGLVVSGTFGRMKGSAILSSWTRAAIRRRTDICARMPNPRPKPAANASATAIAISISMKDHSQQAFLMQVYKNLKSDVLSPQSKLPNMR